MPFFQASDEVGRGIATLSDLNRADIIRPYDVLIETTIL